MFTPPRLHWLMGLSVLLVGASAFASVATVDVRPKLIQLGHDKGATLTFKGFNESIERIRLGCTSGEIRSTRLVGDDVVVEWSPSQKQELEDVLCAGVSASGTFGVAIVPLARAEPFTLTQLPPLSRVEVDIAGEHFGPVRADGDGRVELQIVRKASAASAHVKATPPSGTPVELDQPLARAQVGPALLVPAVSQLVADGQASVTLHAFALDAGGLSDEPSLTAVTPEGSVSLRKVAPGVFTGSWTPPPHTAEEDAALSLRGRFARARVRLIPGMKARCSLHVREPLLAADGLSMTLIIARVTDTTGRPLPLQPLKLYADRGVIGAVTDRGDGTYVVPFTAPSGSPGVAKIRAEVGGALLTEATITLVHGTGIAVEPLDPTLPADGKSQTILRITARDEKGVPLPNGTVVTLSASLGEVPETTTLNDGRADVLFKSGTEAGAAVITVKAGKAEQTGVVHLTPGEPSKIEVHADRTQVRCGESARLRVTVRDQFGNDVPQANVQLAAAKGSLSPLQPINTAFESTLLAECEDREAADPVRVDAKVGEVHASTTVEVEPKQKPYSLKASLGAQTDLASQTLGMFGIEVQAPLPLSDELGEKLRLGLELTGARGAMGRAGASMYGLYLSPLYLLHESERWSVAAGGGLDAHLVSAANKSATLMGLHARFVYDHKAGPGDVVAQLRGGMPFDMISDVPSPAGLDVTVGYQVRF